MRLYFTMFFNKIGLENGAEFCVSGLARPGAKVAILVAPFQPPVARSENASPATDAGEFLLGRNVWMFTLAIRAANFKTLG